MQKKLLQKDEIQNRKSPEELTEQDLEMVTGGLTLADCYGESEEFLKEIEKYHSQNN